MSAEIGAFLSALADFGLAAAAGYVALEATRGWRKEARARQVADIVEKEKLREDAKTLYASASLQKPIVLLVILSSVCIKGIEALSAIFQALSP